MARARERWRRGLCAPTRSGGGGDFSTTTRAPARVVAEGGATHYSGWAMAVCWQDWWGTEPRASYVCVCAVCRGGAAQGRVSRKETWEYSLVHLLGREHSSRSHKLKCVPSRRARQRGNDFWK